MTWYVNFDWPYGVILFTFKFPFVFIHHLLWSSRILPCVQRSKTNVKISKTQVFSRSCKRPFGVLSCLLHMYLLVLHDRFVFLRQNLVIVLVHSKIKHYRFTSYWTVGQTKSKRAQALPLQARIQHLEISAWLHASLVFRGVSRTL